MFSQQATVLGRTGGLCLARNVFFAQVAVVLFLLPRPRRARTTLTEELHPHSPSGMDQAAVEAAIKQALSDAVQTGGALTGPIEAIASKAAQDVLKTESSAGGSLEGVV